MQTLRRTPLHDRHVALGARMVPFAGWEMPVQYEGVIPEHRAVREDGGVFDVSHMGELEVEGPRARELLQSLLSNDLDRIAPGGAQYTLLTNERGGIVDDLIVYELDPFRFLLIVNASNREADFAWLKEREVRGSDVRDVSDEYGADRGAGTARARAARSRRPRRAFTFAEGEVAGITCMVNRTGYTGEEGVELLVMAEDAATLWDAVLERGVTPCGLGARDTLRLEVCYPLHGNDIGPDTDAISAGLGWVCALDKEFTGVEELRRIKEAGPGAAARRVRDGGEGGPAPGDADRRGRRGHLGDALADARRRASAWATSRPRWPSPGTELTIDVRGRHRRARVVKKPIYQREEMTVAAESYPDDSGTTPSTTGPASRATRRRSASPGTPRTRSASSSTTSRRTSARRSRRTAPTARSSR